MPNGTNAFLDNKLCIPLFVYIYIYNLLQSEKSQRYYKPKTSY